MIEDRKVIKLGKYTHRSTLIFLKHLRQQKSS